MKRILPYVLLAAVIVVGIRVLASSHLTERVVKNVPHVIHVAYAVDRSHSHGAVIAATVKVTGVLATGEVVNISADGAKSRSGIGTHTIYRDTSIPVVLVTSNATDVPALSVIYQDKNGSNCGSAFWMVNARHR